MKKYILVIFIAVLCKINTAHTMEVPLTFDKTNKQSCINYLVGAFLERASSLDKSIDAETLHHCFCETIFDSQTWSPLPPEPGKIEYGQNLAVSLSMLCEITQYLRNTSQEYIKDGRRLTVTEIATGCGNLSVFLPLLVDCDLVFVDQNQKALDVCKTRVDKSLSLLSLNPRPAPTFICIDFEDLQKEYPGLKERMDCVIALNLQHFLGPDKDQKFYTCLSFLMKQNARAFLTAQNTICPRSDPLFAFIKSQEESRVPYPGFTKYRTYMYQEVRYERKGDDIILKHLINDDFFYGPTFGDIKRPSNSKNYKIEQTASLGGQNAFVNITYRTKEETFCKMYLKNDCGGPKVLFLARFPFPKTDDEIAAALDSRNGIFCVESVLRVTYNHFTPGTYEKAIARNQKSTNLSLICTFCTDQEGVLSGDPGKQYFTSAIIKKDGSTPIPRQTEKRKPR